MYLYLYMYMCMCVRICISIRIGICARVRARRCMRAIEAAGTPDLWVLPLHSMISVMEQRLVFQRPPRGQRKVPSLAHGGGLRSTRGVVRCRSFLYGRCKLRCYQHALLPRSRPYSEPWQPAESEYGSTWSVPQVVVTTNIAETSITIDDVEYVIDCGRHKQTKYDPANRISMLVARERRRRDRNHDEHRS